MCDYTLSSKTQLSWNIFDPSNTSELSPIPNNDHTSGAQGSGYVYAETTELTAHETALMTSKVYDVLNITYRASSDQFRCLEFYYYLNGMNAAKLNVII